MPRRVWDREKWRAQARLQPRETFAGQCTCAPAPGAPADRSCSVSPTPANREPPPAPCRGARCRSQEKDWERITKDRDDERAENSQSLLQYLRPPVASVRDWPRAAAYW